MSTERQRAILAKNVTNLIMNFDTDPNLLVVGLDREEDLHLADQVLCYHIYAIDEAKGDVVDFMWAMNSIIHFCLVDWGMSAPTVPEKKLCPKCTRGMIRHADGEWVCHHTHII
jgi:hypothetical protein